LFKKEVQTEVKTEVQTEVKTEVQTEVKTEVQTEVKTEVQTEVQTEVKTEVQTEVKTEVQTEVQTSNLLELFNKVHRGMLYEELERLLQKSYSESPMYTLKCIAHIRDACGGRGERDLSKKAYRWLEKWHETHLIINMELFIKKFGRWDDLIYLPLRSKSSTHYLSLMSKQLTADLENMKNGNPVSKVAKWVPSEKSNGHNHAEINAELAKIMGKNQEHLRKIYLTPLRKYISETKQPECNSHNEYNCKSDYSFDEMMNILSNSRYDDVLVPI
jgi:hypothetical protein